MMDFFVEAPRAGQVAGLLAERGINFSVAVRDVGVLEKCENDPKSTIVGSAGCLARPENKITCCRSNPQLQYSSSVGSRQQCEKQPIIMCSLFPIKIGPPGGSMNWTDYHSLSTINSYLDKMAATYPLLCKVSVIGRSYEGREIKLLKISNGNPNNKGVWLDGAIHAREWISVSVVTYIANELLEKFDNHPESITNKDWYIVPVLNPDGYVYTHTEDRMWRKNRKKYGQCVGVDINRNFSYGWGETGEKGSSEDPGNIFYRGPEPFSEAESTAVMKTILEAKTEFKVFISFHSYGEVIIFPWGYTGKACPDYVKLLEGGTAMARAIDASGGTTYKVGSTKDLMYYAAGTSIDWSYGVAKIPYSYMVELPSKTHRFLLPKNCINDTASEMFCGIQALMTLVDVRSKETSSSRSSTRSKI